MLPTDTKLEAQRNKKSSSHPQKASATTIEGNQRTGSLLRAAGNHEVICFLLSSYYFAELKISSEYVYLRKVMSAMRHLPDKPCTAWQEARL